MTDFERTLPQRGLSGRAIWIGVSIMAALLHAAWFSPTLIAGGVQNQDVAGIVYNARVLLNGGLPYLDTVEMKSPGAFFAVAPALALGGLRGIWLLAIAWATATSLATGLLVATCWGPRNAAVAVLLHAAGAHAAGIGDANYSFWMTLPFTLTQAAVLRNRSRWGWAIVGALACAALAFKHNALTLAFPLALGLARAIQLSETRDLPRALLAMAAGATAVLLCLVVPYVLAGKVGALVEAIDVQLRYSSSYIADAGGQFGGPITLFLEGFECAVKHAPGVFAVAALGLLRTGQHSVARAAWLSAASVTLSGALALALTLRFFHHDLVMIWPAAILVALTPGGVPDKLLGLVRAQSAQAFVATAIGLLVTAASFPQAMALRLDLLGLDASVADVCRTYTPSLQQDATVFAWGWNAWSTYEHCRRFAPGPHYKELGIVTTINTNTCARHDGAPMRLVAGPDLDALENELRARSPSLIVVAPYYHEMGSRDPLEDFRAAQDLLRTEYVRVPGQQGFKVWLHRNMAARLPPNHPAFGGDNEAGEGARLEATQTPCALRSAGCPGRIAFAEEK